MQPSIQHRDWIKHRQLALPVCWWTVRSLCTSCSRDISSVCDHSIIILRGVRKGAMLLILLPARRTQEPHSTAELTLQIWGRGGGWVAPTCTERAHTHTHTHTHTPAWASTQMHRAHTHLHGQAHRRTGAHTHTHLHRAHTHRAHTHRNTQRAHTHTHTHTHTETHIEHTHTHTHTHRNAQSTHTEMHRAHTHHQSGG